MKNWVFSVFVVIFTVIPFEVKCVKDVPAILWNIRGDALPIKPVSAFEVSTKKYMDNLLKESLNRKSTVMLVFLAEELSLEDFSPESPTSSDTDLQVLGELLDTQPHMLLPHVQDPLKHLHNVHCEKEELRLDGTVGTNTFQRGFSALNTACVVILHLQSSKDSAGTGNTQAGIAKDILSSLSTSTFGSKKNVIGMFTAKKSSWSSPENQHKSRSLLAQDDKPEVGNFLNFSDCIIMYATNVTVTSIDNSEEPPKTGTVIVPFDYDVSDSDCNATESSVRLVIKYTNVTQYPTLIISMTFGRKRNLWSLTDSEVTIRNLTEPTEHTEITELPYVMEAPMTFSYSCGRLVFETTNSTVKYIITIEGFQIQPFDVKNDVFASSFDCVPFFTIPIWMGLIVGILFIIIINTGIYALFSVKTMDRFDDPKGKTISVAFSAD